MGLHPTLRLHLKGAIPKLIIFNLGVGAFARRLFWVPLVAIGFCALAPNMRLAIYVRLPTRK